jgi:hypothetical protein
MKRLTGAVLYARVVRNLRAELAEDYGLPMAEYAHEISAYDLGSEMQPVLSVRFTRTNGSTITVKGIFPGDQGEILIHDANVEMR